MCIYIYRRTHTLYLILSISTGLFVSVCMCRDIVVEMENKRVLWVTLMGRTFNTNLCSSGRASGQGQCGLDPRAML